jgi:hypothetical protein
MFTKFTKFNAIDQQFRETTAWDEGFLRLRSHPNNRNSGVCRGPRRLDSRPEADCIALLAWIEEKMQAQNFVFYSRQGAVVEVL